MTTIDKFSQDIAKSHDAVDMTCLILAGGASRRMGENKAFALLGKGIMLDHVFYTCQKIFSEIIIATKSPDLFKNYEAMVVKDKVEKGGPLGGIYTGLLSARHDHIFCVGCDMPLLNEGVVRYLLQYRFDYDVVVPRVRGALEPLHAVYSKSCIPMIKNSLEKGRLSILGFFAEARVLCCETVDLVRIDPSLASFTNVNTREELQGVANRVQKGD